MTRTKTFFTQSRKLSFVPPTKWIYAGEWEAAMPKPVAFDRGDMEAIGYVWSTLNTAQKKKKLDMGSYQQHVWWGVGLASRKFCSFLVIEFHPLNKTNNRPKCKTSRWEAKHKTAFGEKFFVLIAGKQKLDDFPSMSQMGNVSDLKQRGTFAVFCFSASNGIEFRSAVDKQFGIEAKTHRRKPVQIILELNAFEFQC